MARTPRQETEPGIHHVFARGNDRRTIYHDERDYARYVSLLAEEVAQRRWRCLSYCLMPNHLHLLIETLEPNLATGMHRLQWSYAYGFNRRYERTGHVFEDRYGSVPITDDRQLLTVAGYIAANPVAAGLCARPEDWRWSSHSSTAAGEPRMGAHRLLELLEAWGHDGAKQYQELIDARLLLVEAERYFG